MSKVAKTMIESNTLVHLQFVFFLKFETGSSPVINEDNQFCCQNLQNLVPEIAGDDNSPISYCIVFAYL